MASPGNVTKILKNGNESSSNSLRELDKRKLVENDSTRSDYSNNRTRQRHNKGE